MASISLTENQLYGIIKESVNQVLSEGIYDYPDGIDHLIFLAENDRECYDLFWQIVNALKKKFDKGVELSVDALANSSIMKKYQQFCFRKFKREQPNIDPQAPFLFRKYMSERIVDRINDGEY